MKLEEIKARKGARRMAEIPKDVLAALNRGLVPTANLVEFLAIDMAVLVENALAECKAGALAKPVVQRARDVASLGVMTRLAEIGKALGQAIREDEKTGRRVFSAFAEHPSDLVREFAVYTYLGRDDLGIDGLLAAMRPFAADPHFGVRECAWFAGRDAVIRDLDRSLRALARWAEDADPNIRRFASEITRPRGVWCAQIDALKRDPTPGLIVLEPLKGDPSKYVQDSVGNWINDASKSAAAWAEALCKRWGKESPTSATARIVMRGLRTLVKKAESTAKPAVKRTAAKARSKTTNRSAPKGRTRKPARRSASR